ncbi:hypothetical protein Sjap_011649 [Stephania japonica]|uniref:Uncharacterized protein n=1 Tax=Stephania japonica TaxID=461633 RepID=A0AAP0JDX0_9MAGN
MRGGGKRGCVIFGNKVGGNADLGVDSLGEKTTEELLIRQADWKDSKKNLQMEAINTIPVVQSGLCSDVPQVDSLGSSVQRDVTNLEFNSFVPQSVLRVQVRESECREARIAREFTGFDSGGPALGEDVINSNGSQSQEKWIALFKQEAAATILQQKITLLLHALRLSTWMTARTFEDPQLVRSMFELGSPTRDVGPA